MPKPYIANRLVKTIKNYKGKDPKKLHWDELFKLLNCDEFSDDFGRFQYTLANNHLYIYCVEDRHD